MDGSAGVTRHLCFLEEFSLDCTSRVLMRRAERLTPNELTYITVEKAYFVIEGVFGPNTKQVSTRLLMYDLVRYFPTNALCLYCQSYKKT